MPCVRLAASLAHARVALFLAIAVASASAQNLLLNPSFEQPVVASGGYQAFGVGQTIGAGWVVDFVQNQTVVIDRGYQGGSATWYAPTDGNQYLYVGDNTSQSTIHQDVMVSTAGTYQLTFDLANFASWGNSNGARVIVDVTDLVHSSSVLNGGQSFTRALGAGYGEQRINFIAGVSGAYRVTLSSVSSYGANVDDFVLTRIDAMGLTYCFGDGGGASCPCNNPSSVGHGCPNAQNVSGAILFATGSFSIGADTGVLSASGMPNSSTLYFQGTAQQSGGVGIPFGDGLRCASGTITRLASTTNASGASAYPGPGDASISTRGGVSTPGIRTYQAWYRNAATYCTTSTFNLTNGVQITWMP